MNQLDPGKKNYSLNELLKERDTRNKLLMALAKLPELEQARECVIELVPPEPEPEPIPVKRPRIETHGNCCFHVPLLMSGKRMTW